MNAITEQDSPKERLLKTVERLFYEQGYQATGVNQIIAEAQVCKASFYQHFPSKEALVLEYIETHHRDFMRRIKQAVAQQSKSSEKLLTLFDFLEVNNESWGGCTFINMAAEFAHPHSQPRQLIARCKSELRDYIEQLVRACLPANTPKETVKLKATAVYLLLEAAMMESRIHHDSWPVRDGQEVVRQMLN
ncbi:MAG: TetR/AcrR family transcriptional regulator [Cyanophyceae cyanobacterium]